MKIGRSEFHVGFLTETFASIRGLFGLSPVMTGLFARPSKAIAPAMSVTRAFSLRFFEFWYKNLSQAREQGYLDIDCKLYIDIHDIDRYLSGELDTIGEIYAFPEDIKSHQE